MKCRDQLHELVKEEIEKKDSSMKEWKIAMERSFNRMDNEKLADYIGLPCQIARGCKYCVADHRSSCLIQIEDDGKLPREYVVDLVREPGNVHGPDSSINGVRFSSRPSPFQISHLKEFQQPYIDNASHCRSQTQSTHVPFENPLHSLENQVSKELAFVGWGSFEMGYGRKVDPEPGRCRRANGKKWSYVHGVRDEVDSRAPFPEASGTPLTTSSSNTAYSQLDFHGLTGSGKSREQQQQQKHCFVLDSDFRSGKPMEVEREEKQKPFHHFFGEWQPKSREYSSWLDIEEEEKNQSSHGSFSTTQLSISMPPSTQELFGSKSTFPTGK
ncbi:Serine/threonine-protein kinase CTR1 [Camellia lanceoleosa]|uniref:Serine/threonine-protein kinase CTR1 n=1 Tax=Camellia lanceoleosa TaxID=1840588 RepID=A0ACC0I4L7_9ERIC|nr:Serine/threonine-protein kinase CTR1 [Camellia lanceoleosa]